MSINLTNNLESKKLWLQNKKNEIKKLADSNKLPNVFLVTGPDNTLLSYEITKIIQNKETINNDLVTLGASTEEKITINDIRDLLEQAQQTAYAEARKVFILLNIETMNNAATNCLLKILEADNSNNYFILTTNNPHKILATIVSRCFKVTIKPSHQEIIDWLSKSGVNKQEQETLLELANFSPSLALEYYQDHYINKIADIMNCINSLSEINIFGTTKKITDLINKYKENTTKKPNTLYISNFIAIINYIIVKLSFKLGVNYRQTLDIIKYYKQIADNNVTLDINNMVYRIMYSIATINAKLKK